VYTFPDSTLRPCVARYGIRSVYAACTRPVNTSSPAKTARIRSYNGRAVYKPVHGRVWAVHNTRPCMGRAHGPSTPPVYMTVYGSSARMSSSVYMVRTRPRTRDVYRSCTGRAHGRVHDTYTAAYTCLRVQGPCTRPVRAIYTAEKGRLHRRTRLRNVSCIRPCTGRIG